MPSVKRRAFVFISDFAYIVSMDDSMKLAVLIDAENVSYRYVDIIMDELAKEGTITYRRIYGDFSSSGTKGWKDTLLENSIVPVQSFPYTSGKNSTDTTMVIDAMDILYTGKVDGFCLVSSDCDFTRLASRLKEAGMKVIGMGEQKTPAAFVAACSVFKYLDLLLAESQGDDKNGKNDSKDKRVSGIASERTIARFIKGLVDETESDRLNISTIGNALKNKYTDFDCRNYGYKKLSSFLEHLGYDVKRNNLILE